MALFQAAGLVIVVSLALYVILDGFDLGVGALLLFRDKESERDAMVEAIAPTWDGNETWMILAGVGLLACFPIVYATLLPAVYVPIILMLASLGFRGVSFEFRFQTVTWRTFWDRAFAIGSIIAAFAQGLVLGAALQGVATDGHRFSGGALDFLTPFSVLAGVSVVCAYVCLGSAWLRIKTVGPLEVFGSTALRVSACIMAILSTAVFAAGITVQKGMGAAWASYGDILLLLGILWYGSLVRAAAVARSNRAYEPFAWLVVGYSCVLAGIVVTVHPFILPFTYTLAHAKSPTDSEQFFVIGALVVVPVILGYSALSYRVFRGKISEDNA